MQKFKHQFKDPRRWIKRVNLVVMLLGIATGLYGFYDCINQITEIQSGNTLNSPLTKRNIIWHK